MDHHGDRLSVRERKNQKSAEMQYCEIIKNLLEPQQPVEMEALALVEVCLAFLPMIQSKRHDA
jgi:hypothetical protein